MVHTFEETVEYLHKLSELLMLFLNCFIKQIAPNFNIIIIILSLNVISLQFENQCYMLKRNFNQFINTILRKT